MWTDRVLIIPRTVVYTCRCGSTPLPSSIVLPRLRLPIPPPSNRKSYHTSIDYLFGLCTISRRRKVGHKAIQEPAPIRSGLLDPRQPFPV